MPTAQQEQKVSAKCNDGKGRTGKEPMSCDIRDESSTCKLIYKIYPVVFLIRAYVALMLCQFVSHDALLLQLLKHLADLNFTLVNSCIVNVSVSCINGFSQGGCVIHHCP